MLVGSNPALSTANRTPKLRLPVAFPADPGGRHAIGAVEEVRDVASQAATQLAAICTLINGDGLVSSASDGWAISFAAQGAAENLNEVAKSCRALELYLRSMFTQEAGRPGRESEVAA